MSKERARRREARQREAAVLTAARASQAERAERRARRRRAIGSRLPERRSRPSGVLAARRRQHLVTTAGVLVAVNVLVGVLFPGWANQAMALIVSLLAAPVLHTLLFRR
jgi:Flp pilus assembly protein TadB